MTEPVLLLSSLHDPEARLWRLAARLADPASDLGHAWARIAPRYHRRLVVPSPATDPRTVRALQEAGWVVAPGSDGPDRGLWAMVERGLAEPVAWIHFCDLDRLLHWLGRFPDELRQLAAIWDRHDLTMLVRTPRAFATHPPCQVLTEGPVNRLIGARIGIPEADAFSGSYVWSRRAAAAILACAGPRDLRFYAEGVLAPFRAGCSIGYYQVEGLEWETPDQYPEEITRLGSAAWLARFESPAQWRQRVEMMGRWIEAVLR